MKLIISIVIILAVVLPVILTSNPGTVFTTTGTTVLTTTSTTIPITTTPAPPPPCDPNFDINVTTSLTVIQEQHGNNIYFKNGLYYIANDTIIGPNWNHTFNTFIYDSTPSIIVDDEGNVYVFGLVTNISIIYGSTPSFAVKLNSLGVEQWRTFINQYVGMSPVSFINQTTFFLQIDYTNYIYINASNGSIQPVTPNNFTNRYFGQGVSNYISYMTIPFPRNIGVCKLTFFATTFESQWCVNFGESYFLDISISTDDNNNLIVIYFNKIRKFDSFGNTVFETTIPSNLYPFEGLTNDYGKRITYFDGFIYTMMSDYTLYENMSPVYLAKTNATDGVTTYRTHPFLFEFYDWSVVIDNVTRTLYFYSVNSIWPYLAENQRRKINSFCL